MGRSFQNCNETGDLTLQELTGCLKRQEAARGPWFYLLRVQVLRRSPTRPRAGSTLNGETMGFRYSGHATSSISAQGTMALSVLPSAFPEHPLPHAPSLEYEAGGRPHFVQADACYSAAARDGFLELNQGIDPRAPELQPRPLPPAAPVLLEYSLRTLSSPQNLHAPRPGRRIWTSCFLALPQGLTPRLAHAGRSRSVVAVTSGGRLSLPVYRTAALPSGLCVGAQVIPTALGIDRKRAVTSAE